jgi:hypothetical protein
MTCYRTQVITATGVPIDLANVDIQADNGVVHFLQAVMVSIPAGDTLETLPLVSAAQGYGFEGLAHALDLLSLVDTLAGRESFHKKNKIFFSKLGE